MGYGRPGGFVSGYSDSGLSHLDKIAAQNHKRKRACACVNVNVACRVVCGRFVYTLDELYHARRRYQFCYHGYRAYYYRCVSGWVLFYQKEGGVAL